MIFDALSNVAYRVSLRGPGVELEGGGALKNCPHQPIAFLINISWMVFWKIAFCFFPRMTSESISLNNVELMDVHYADITCILFRNFQRFQLCPGKLVAPILCVEVAIALAPSRIIVYISKSSRERQAL